MSEVKTDIQEKNVWTEKKGWRPDEGLKYSPIFQFSEWSYQSLAKYFFGWGGYLLPWNFMYYILAYITVYYWNPPLEQCRNFSLSWILPIFFRNEILIWIFAGSWHLILYIWKKNGTKNKYDPEWQSTGNPKFIFKDQVLDNIFWCTTSGVFVWTLYECGYLYLMANNKIPYYTSLSEHPIWTIVMLLVIPYWRESHFFWTHSMMHWPPLYRIMHYVHHKNYNPGPWSGIAMHPLEHLIYFGMALAHLFVFSPVHFFLNTQLTALTPAYGHIGYHGPVWNDLVPAGSYFHYLHHRYYECNYGESNVPFDRIFGTFFDGKNKDFKPRKDYTPFIIVGTIIGVLPVILFFYKILTY